MAAGTSAPSYEFTHNPVLNNSTLSYFSLSRKYKMLHCVLTYHEFSCLRFPGAGSRRTHMHTCGNPHVCTSGTTWSKLHLKNEDSYLVLNEGAERGLFLTFLTSFITWPPEIFSFKQRFSMSRVLPMYFCSLNHVKSMIDESNGK